MDVVLNWIWQGALVALAAAAVLRGLAPSRPQARYAVAWVASILVLALPGVPVAWAVAGAPPAASESAPLAPLVAMPATWWTSRTLAFTAWAVWVAVHGVKLALGLIEVRRVRRRCRVCPPHVEARLRQWAGVRDSGRRTRLVLCDGVPAAAVLGGGAPIIALAPALLQRLDVADLDSVVIHEWAHVQRHDDVAQVAELLVRAVAGWHPALWWLGKQLHVEREAACDALAVGVTGSASRYAACLATVAALDAEPARPFPALAAASCSDLGGRIVRILALRGVPSTGYWRGVALAAAVLLAALAVGVSRVEVVGAASLALAPEPPASEGGGIGWQSAALAPSRALHVSAAADAGGPRGVGRPARLRSVPAVMTRPPHAAPAPIARAGGARPFRSARVPQGIVSASPVLPRRDIGWWPHGVPLLVERGSPPSSWPASALREDTTTAAGRASAPPWTAAAEAGRTIGRGSDRAARATAGFFNRLGSTIAGSF